MMCRKKQLFAGRRQTTVFLIFFIRICTQKLVEFTRKILENMPQTVQKNVKKNLDKVRGLIHSVATINQKGADGNKI